VDLVEELICVGDRHLNSSGVDDTMKSFHNTQKINDDNEVKVYFLHNDQTTKTTTQIEDQSTTTEPPFIR
jgi:hypothetical protein